MYGCTPYCVLESRISLRFTLRPVVWSYRPFETNVPNDPIMALNTKRVKVPHICVTSVLESQISVRFILRLAVFELQDIFKHQGTQKRHWTLQGQRFPKYVLPMSLCPRFHSVLLYNQALSTCETIENRKCTEWPQTDLEHIKVTVKYLVLINYLPPETHILVRFATRPAVFKILGLFVENRKYTKWP